MSWPIVKLGDVCDLQNGYAFKSSDYVEESNTLSCRMSNIRPGGVFNIDYNSRFLPDEFAEKYKQFLLKDGDVIIAMTDLADSPKILGVPTVVKTTGRNILLNQRVGKLVIRDTSIIHFPYLKLALNYPRVRDIYKKYAGGGLQINLGKSDLLSVEIPLPPLAEQKRIAAILDKADAIRRKRQQAIQLADDFLRAVFLEMFGDPVTNQKGWEEAVLKDIADIRSGVTKGKKINPDDAITLPYMRVANVQDGYLALDDIQEITVSRRDAEKCKLMIGDILLTEGGDPDKLGRGYVWSGEIDNCIHQNHIFSVRVNDQSKIRPAFLSAVISSQRGKQYFLKVGKQTTGIATINKTVLSEFLPFIPPVEVQDKYLEISKKVRSLFLGWGDNCSYAFNALSQKAFSGKL
ncbi:restriction endonuclease subunit S [Shewanella oncorhynchi]|uniref:restriction endonuclease subunit S n=1 Tax=Shewanella oncorhynchi TaxID=2726434 RepID=UPI003D78D8DA